MARTVEEVMTRDPRTVNADDPIIDAARIMRDDDIGNVIVRQDGEVAGIVTDRDIVVRGVAEGVDARSTPVREVCTTGIEAIEPSASVDDALRKMREADVRRLPVVDDGGAGAERLARVDEADRRAVARQLPVLALMKPRTTLGPRLASSTTSVRNSSRT